MRDWSSWGVVAVVAILGLARCGGDGGGTEPDPEPESAIIEVTVTSDAAGVEGVTVRLYDAGSSTARSTQTTNGSGEAQFAGLGAGNYEVEIDVPEDHELEEGQSARRSVTAVAGSTAQAEFRLTSGAPIVEIRLTSNLRFEPSEVTISPGTTVRWVNETDMLHTITPDGHTEWERAELSTNGEVFAHSFTESGEFPYFCEPHVDFGMMGSITVQ